MQLKFSDPNFVLLPEEQMMRMKGRNVCPTCQVHFCQGNCFMYWWHMFFTFNPYMSLCVWGICVWIFLCLLSVDNVCVGNLEIILGICYSFCLNDRRKIMHSVDDDDVCHDNNKSWFLLMVVSKLGNVKLSVLRNLMEGIFDFAIIFQRV